MEHRWRHGVLLFLASVLALSAFVTLCHKKGGVFESDSLDRMFEAMLEMSNTLPLKHQIHFHRPRSNEKLPLNSLILTDRNSELVLRFELVHGNEELTTPFIIDQLEAMMIPGSIEARQGEYYKTIPGGSVYILRDVSGDNFFDMFDIFVDAYLGTVRLSTDVEKISRINSGMPVWGGIASEVSKSGVVRGHVSKGALGLALIAESVRVKDFTGARIDTLIENSPAHKVGLSGGDIIIKVNGKTFNDVEDCIRLIEIAKGTGAVNLTVYRDSRLLDFTIQLDYANAQGLKRGHRSSVRQGTCLLS